MYWPVFLFVYLFVSISAKAQPGFTSNITRGCAPLTITVTNHSTDGTEIGYDFGNGITASTTHTFDKPGKYTIKQVGNFVSSSGGDTLILEDYIEVLNTPLPAFKVSSCKGNTVNVKITEAIYDAYVINFGDGFSQTVAPNGTATHTYTTLTQQTVIVTGQYTIQPNPPGGVCGNASSQTITPIQELVKPEIKSLEVKNASTIDLNFGVLPHLSYKIYQKMAASSAYQEVAAIADVAGNFAQTLSNVNTAQTVYTYKIVATDICNNTVSSEEISTILLAGSAVNDQNNLNWQQGAISFQKYTINRNAQLFTELTTTTQRTYADQTVQCPNEYCYQISGVTASGAISVSNLVCIKAISATQPPAVENLTATIENGIPVISWKLPAGVTAKEFIISRADNGGPFLELDRTTEFRYSDAKSSINTSANTYCYQVAYSDACSNQAAIGLTTCPVLLTKKLNGTALELNWTAYREWVDGVKNYTIEKLDEQGNVYESISIGSSLSFSIDLSKNVDEKTQILRFRIKAISNSTAIQASYSNIIEVVQAMQLHLPQAFTPNNDALNEVFTARGFFIQQFNMIIYNRWGEVIFVSDDILQGWNATVNGNQAPAGNYVYSIQVIDFTGGRYTKNGTFSLIR